MQLYNTKKGEQSHSTTTIPTSLAYFAIVLGNTEAINFHQHLCKKEKKKKDERRVTRTIASLLPTSLSFTSGTSLYSDIRNTDTGSSSLHCLSVNTTQHETQKKKKGKKSKRFG